VFLPAFGTDSCGLAKVIKSVGELSFISRKLTTTCARAEWVESVATSQKSNLKEKMFKNGTKIGKNE